MATSQPTVDFTNGRAFLHEGVLYYSPNSKRSIIVPNFPVSDPFATKNNKMIDFDMFMQPCWWTSSWGWMSFIPLAPSFASYPFEPFCWMPHIEKISIWVRGINGAETRETRYKMSDADIHKWKMREEKIKEAAYKIRLIHGITHGISANAPPSPSDFHYDCPHRSISVARRMITWSRDWFSIWMGILGFLIAQASKLPMKNCPHPPPGFPTELPPWYWLLNTTMGFSPSWLDGLLSSSVVNPECARAGVIYRLSDRDVNRPLPYFFLDHKVPIWFPWTSDEEYAVRQNPSLLPFAPPPSLLQEAVTLIFRSPALSFAETIAKYFCKSSDGDFASAIDVLRKRDAPSFVYEYATKKFTGSQQRTPITKAQITNLVSTALKERQHAAEVAITLPQQTMLEGLDAEDRGLVCTHPNDFILAREKRQQGVIESQKDVQSRQSREKNPPTKNTTMYEWIKHALPGGQDIYVRVRVSKANHIRTYSMYSKRYRIYNAMCNEWDFSEEFSHPVTNPNSRTDEPAADDDDDDDDDDTEYEYDYNHEDYDQRITYHSPEVISVSQTASSAHQEPQDQFVEYSPSKTPWSCDAIETMAWVYGYVPVLNIRVTNPPSTANWLELLQALGFRRESSVVAVDDANRSSMWNFFSAMITNKRPSSDLYDLDERNRAALNFLAVLKDIQHTPGLFIFSSPASNTCDWVLGVYTPSAALYVIRYIISRRTNTSASISSMAAFTIFNVAAHLAERGIPFRTLLPLSCSSRSSTITQVYTPSVFRDLQHPFDVSDFEEAMLRCKALLTSPRGRAAILMGGIIGRIAKEYISIDAALSGPSAEITVHRVGYFGPEAGGDKRYCDDELTEHEIAIICGTYTMYTGAVVGQTTTRSWLPPPAAWYKNGAGFRWLEWTEKSESFFVQLLQDIRNGKARPLTVVNWRSKIRGLKPTRDLLDYSDEQAGRFVDQHLPCMQIA